FEPAVRNPATRRQHESGCGQRPCGRDLDARRSQRNWNTANRLVVSEGDFYPLRPHEPSLRYRILLRKRKVADPSVLDLQMARDLGAPWFVDPDATPSGEILRGSRIKDLDEIRPCRVPEKMCIEVLAEAVAKAVRAKNHFELPHDDRRLLIND